MTFLICLPRVEICLDEKRAVIFSFIQFRLFFLVKSEWFIQNVDLTESAFFFVSRQRIIKLLNLI